MEHLLRAKISSIIIKESLKFDELRTHSLLVGNYAGFTTFLLVNQDFGTTLVAQLNKSKEDPSNVMDWCHYSYAFDWLYRDIVGMVQILESKGEAYDCWEVKRAATRSGWGPTMYDIVMGLSPNGLMSDRSEVSEDAFGVYKYYLDNRDDISRKPLDVRNFTPESFDDAELGNRGIYLDSMFGDSDKTSQSETLQDPLNWVYNRPEVPVTKTLLKRGELDVKSSVCPSPWSDTQFQTFVFVTGGQFFNWQI
jgi:hypothetical protein